MSTKTEYSIIGKIEEKKITSTIAAKLDFKNFRTFKKVENIRSIYDTKKRLAAGSFGTVYEAVHIAT